MADYAIDAQPMAAWQLSLQGSDNVQFNGQLLRACVSAAIECAATSGCLTEGSVHLTEECGETLRAHNAEADCVAQGFGLRVAATDAIASLPTKAQHKIGEWLP